MLSVPAFSATNLVYLLAGQSNAIGQGNTANTSASNQSLLTDDAASLTSYSVETRGNIVNGNSYITDDWTTSGTSVFAASGYAADRFGMELGLRKGLNNRGVDNVYIIKFAAGGARLNDDFLKGATNGALFYDEMISFVNLQLTNLTALTGESSELASMIWMQGEGDATAFSTANFTDKYKSNFSTFISDVRTDLGQSDLQVVAVPLNEQATVTQSGGTIASYQANAATINRGVAELAALDSNLFIADSTNGLALNDYVHYNGDSLLDIGCNVSTILVIPEPSSALLLGLGGLTLVYRRKRNV